MILAFYLGYRQNDKISYWLKSYLFVFGRLGRGYFLLLNLQCVFVCLYIHLYIFLSMQAFYCCVWFICTNTWPDLFFTFVFIYEGIQSLSTKHPLSFKRQSLTLTSSMFKDLTLKISIKKFIVISSLKKNIFIKTSWLWRTLYFISNLDMN